MNRRQYLGGVVGGVASLAGCTASSDDDTATDADTGTPTPSVVEVPFGEQVRVTAYATTAPIIVRFADEIVFSRRSGEVVWTAPAGSRFVLVRVAHDIVATGEKEMAPFPHWEPYSVRAKGRTYQERESPEDTNAIDEPMWGGYATGGPGSGRVGARGTDWLAFEVPDDVAVADLAVRYERRDGRPVVWRPTEENVVWPTPERTSTST